MHFSQVAFLALLSSTSVVAQSGLDDWRDEWPRLIDDTGRAVYILPDTQCHAVKDLKTLEGQTIELGNIEELYNRHSVFCELYTSENCNDDSVVYENAELEAFATEWKNVQIKGALCNDH
ncbi:uncharacterized protein N7482_009976 [Penicillium canariense]|uniref:Uncharacterized protein n=1 Tax=Penicillium canariense TaxID=189055 RepID=A0A9W9HNI6_9EURO|nr:uncharacterized protein N7482_009976 [Penicillium canariense]KAJ5153498.1 hypothetical protein N7482_009976 [Penicillium canariense]